MNAWGLSIQPKEELVKLTAKNSVRGVLLGTAAGAMVLAGTGIASAATVGAAGSAVTLSASSAYQVCGNFYVGPDAHVAGVTSGAKAVVGAQVTGKLYSSSSSTTPITTFTATTNAAGGWCMQGDSAMASTVTSGGEVRMSTDTPTVLDGTTTRTGQWSGGGADAVIDAGEFLLHGNAFIFSDRASKVNFYYQ